MNKKIYCIFSGIAVLLIIPYLAIDNRISAILSSVGCSIVAATVMAYFMDSDRIRREQTQLHKSKNMYFHSIYEQLKMFCERFLYFDEIIAEPTASFDMQPKEYYTLKYILESGSLYKGKGYSYEEGISLVKEKAKKYSLDELNKKSDDERVKIKKMFLILAEGSGYLLKEANRIKDDELVIETEGFADIKQIEEILFDISLGISLMYKEDKSYGAAMDALVDALDQVRKLGGYNDGLRSGFHSSLDMKQI